MKIATLIKALDRVGQIYRNKDGSQPADAVRKVQQQLQGAADMTLAEWVEAKQSKLGSGAKKAPKTQIGEAKVEEALTRLEQADTHAALSAAAGGLRLSAAEWQALSRKLTGRSAKSGKAARQIVEQHFNDGLLLKERVESVKRAFA